MPEILSGESIGSWKVERTLSFGEPALVAAISEDGASTEAVLKVSKLHRMAQSWQDRLSFVASVLLFGRAL